MGQAAKGPRLEKSCAGRPAREIVSVPCLPLFFFGPRRTLPVFLDLVAGGEAVEVDVVEPPVLAVDTESRGLSRRSLLPRLDALPDFLRSRGDPGSFSALDVITPSRLLSELPGDPVPISALALSGR